MHNSFNSSQISVRATLAASSTAGGYSIDFVIAYEYDAEAIDLHVILVEDFEDSTVIYAARSSAGFRAFSEIARRVFGENRQGSDIHAIRQLAEHIVSEFSLEVRKPWLADAAFEFEERALRARLSETSCGHF